MNTEQAVDRNLPDELTEKAVLELRNVSKVFDVRSSPLPWSKPSQLQAVHDVSLKIYPGETFALVGESGSGKSTLGRVALRLTEPSSGSILFKGEDITSLPEAQLRGKRPQMQVVFQDPYGSLNPRKSVGEAVAEPLRVFSNKSTGEVRREVHRLFEEVGLDPSRLKARPRAFSGGQRQRVGVARAIALNPSLILADEALSALDVSVQAQIANLMVKIQQELGVAYLFIAHGLPIVRQIAHRVAVMYLGSIVETARVDDLFDRPAHPYSRALIGASPIPDPTVSRERILLTGEPPNALNPPSGCRFRTRCPLATDKCAAEVPPVVTVGPPEKQHTVACHYPLTD